MVMKINKSVYTFIKWLANLGSRFGLPKWWVFVMVSLYSIVIAFFLRMNYLLYNL